MAQFLKKALRIEVCPYSFINDLKQSIAIYNQQAQDNDLFSSVYDDSIAGSSTKPENCDHSKNGEALKSPYP